MKELEKKLNAFVKERNWEQYHCPKNLAIGLSVEANELLDIFIWLSENESRQLTPSQMERVEEEIGDVMIHLVNFCKTLGIDPVQCAHNKLEITKKKYPVDKAYGKATKYTDLDPGE